MEQNFMVLFLLLDREPLKAFMVAPYIMAIYGGWIAPIFAILEDEFPQGQHLKAFLSSLIVVSGVNSEQKDLFRSIFYFLVLVVSTVLFYAFSFIWWLILYPTGLSPIAPKS